MIRFVALCIGIVLLVAARCCEADSATLQDTIAQRMLACTACHGKEGRATSQGYFPRIAGKPAGYLFNQLINFRDGRRSNAAMTYFVDLMSDAYLHEIAEYFASLDLPYPPPQGSNANVSELERGQALTEHGDASRDIPACVRCHGASLTGLQPAVPGLLGLPRDYLVGQLGRWRTGERHARPPDCMEQIARHLSAEDIRVIVAWLSSRPMPFATHPATSLPQPAPMTCGSMKP